MCCKLPLQCLPSSCILSLLALTREAPLSACKIHIDQKQIFVSKMCVLSTVFALKTYKPSFFGAAVYGAETISLERQLSLNTDRCPWF